MTVSAARLPAEQNELCRETGAVREVWKQHDRGGRRIGFDRWRSGSDQELRSFVIVNAQARG